MTEPAGSHKPRISIILATDAYATIRPVIERLRLQTIASEMEVVLVATSVETVRDALAIRDAFAAMRIVEYPVPDLAAARAEGIRAATAPIVFVGETHSYPHPNLAELLLAAFEGPWAAVVPAFRNGNPAGVFSWSAFLADYGAWTEGLTAREIKEAPFYNAAYRRSVLLELGDRLPQAISHGDELSVNMRAHGYRVYHEPAAVLEHLNVATPGHWMREKLAAGLLISSQRARRWSLTRRLMYAAGSPLIPIVLLRRVMPGVRRTARRVCLPAGTVLAIVAGLVIKAFGELLGYAGRNPGRAARRMQEYELHKLKYAARGTT